MIVRAVLENPELIETLDMFNDASDTIAWLKNVHTVESWGIAKRLCEKYDQWLRLHRVSRN